MNESPDVADILVTVRDFLARLCAILEKGPKYEAHVAVYLLDIVRRELASPAQIYTDDTRLCEDIRSGKRDALWDETLEAQLVAAIARVRIARPDYLDDGIP
jgi:hypothetical protein